MKIPDLLRYRHREIPSRILNRIKELGQTLQRSDFALADVLIDFRGFWSRGDASIGLAQNFDEAR